MSNDDRFSAEDHYSTRPPKKQSSGLGWVFGISGCILFAVISPFLLVCGCCGGLMRWAVNEKAEKIAAAVQSDEIFQGEIGEVSSSTMNWSDSASAGTDVMVYDVTGDKGSGQLYVFEVDDVTDKIVLHKDGQEWDLGFDPVDIDGHSIDYMLVGAFRNDETIQAEIGEISHLEMNWPESMDEEEESIYVYDIIGDKGKGQVRLEFAADDDTKVVWAKLKKDGRDFDLTIAPSKAAPNAKEMEVAPEAE